MINFNKHPGLIKRPNIIYKNTKIETIDNNPFTEKYFKNCGTKKDYKEFPKLYEQETNFIKEKNIDFKNSFNKFYPKKNNEKIVTRNLIYNSEKDLDEKLKKLEMFKKSTNKFQKIKILDSIKNNSEKISLPTVGTEFMHCLFGYIIYN